MKRSLSIAIILMALTSFLTPEYVFGSSRSESQVTIENLNLASTERVVNDVTTLDTQDLTSINKSEVIVDGQLSSPESESSSDTNVRWFQLAVAG